MQVKTLMKAHKNVEKNLIESICCIAQEAGAAILEIYQTDIEVQRKEDNSPVTAADLAANAIIVKALAKLAPEIPIVTEEEKEHSLPEGTTMFWLVDPLDGTKSFIRREGEFTVNIGLIENGTPSMGIIYVPVKEELYVGVVGEGAWRQIGDGPREAIATREVPEVGMDAVVSLSHLDPKTQGYLEDYTINSRVQAASSLKFCRVAEGVADIYPRFGPTMEWDTAAGHAIVLAAGGRVEQPDGSPFTYGADDFYNGPFVAWGN